MKRHTLTEYLSALAVLGYMGLIFYLSSIPGTQITLPAPDYVMHGLAFGGLSLLFTIFLSHQIPWPNSVPFSLFLTLLFALSDEAHQYFVPFRSPDWRDILADLIGAVLAQVILFGVIHLYSYLQSQSSPTR